MDEKKSEPVLLLVEGTDGPPDLDTAARQLGLTKDELDADYGVVLIDVARRFYVVRSSSPRAAKHPGCFSDPEIGPLGPPK